MHADFSQLWEAGWPLAILRGCATTVAVALGSMLLGLVIGIAGGLIKWARLFPLTILVDCYTALVRGVPELLVIYLLFFGSVQVVMQVATFFGYADAAEQGYAFIIGVGAIGAISGAYSVEVVRGALAEIPKGHIEAAQALGLSRARIFRRIIGPQMFRIAVPGVNNVWQTTIKDTALISVVGLEELMRIASIGAGSTREPFIFYIIAACVYFAITLVSQFAFNRFERRLLAGGHA